LSGDLPSISPAPVVKSTSPRLPPSNNASASRTDAHIARPSTIAVMSVEM
jgi:hypothetical protein